MERILNALEGGVGQFLLQKRCDLDRYILLIPANQQAVPLHSGIIEPENALLQRCALLQKVLLSLNAQHVEMHSSSPVRL